MKNYLFLGMDGYSYDSCHKPISNIQVLGSSQGKDVQDAFCFFKKEQSYLSNFTFTKIVALEYVDNSFVYGLEL